MIKNGYVYILINQSMPDVVKIGKTARNSALRAKELSKTSVPTPFIVAFEIFSTEYDALEKAIHAELHDFRVSTNREFFKYPLHRAIKLLQGLNTPHQTEGDEFEAVDITIELDKKYPNHLKENITSVRIVQPEHRVWLEVTTESISESGFMVDQTIRREDLAFITDDDENNSLYFKREDSVQTNALKFINDFDPFSIIMTTDLFNENVSRKINLKYNPIHSNKK